MVEESEVCPLCDKQNRLFLSVVKEGEPYKEEDCEHRLWDPLREGDFLKEFLKDSRNNQAIRVPQFHALNLDVVPKEALEANREKLGKVLQDNLHEVNGWWFGTIKEKETACKELARLLKPLCNSYSHRT